MTTLTEQEMAEVAREVTGTTDILVSTPYSMGRIVFRRNEENEPAYHWMWEPKLNGNPYERDQALAVVEWLSKKTQNRNPRAHSEILDAVAEGRIDLLQRMVLELKRGR